jgi:hypothetical protein
MGLLRKYQLGGQAWSLESWIAALETVVWLFLFFNWTASTGFIKFYFACPAFFPPATCPFLPFMAGGLCGGVQTHPPAQRSWADWPGGRGL